MASYLALVALDIINSDRLVLILLGISGILTTMTFSEYVLKEDYHNRKKKKESKNEYKG